MKGLFILCHLLYYFSIEFSFLIKYYSLLYQSIIPNCKLTISTLRQHISISDNIEQYIVGAANHRISCQRLINLLLTHLYSKKDYMQFCYYLNIISVMTDLPYRLIVGTYLVTSLWNYFCYFPYNELMWFVMSHNNYMSHIVITHYDCSISYNITFYN